MIFNSLEFFIFFPIVTGLYFFLPYRWRWAVLLLASCVFYMAFIPKYILILLATIVVDYIAGIYIEKAQGRRRKWYLIASIISNVGFLAFFKYYGFAIENLNAIAHFFGWNYSLAALGIILPVGLSFHTFQAMSYTIEVYRGHQPAERHFGIYSLYVMFYPQLVAGPIERPQNLIHQFKEKHSFVWSRVLSGLRLMLWGLFKKIVIADNAAAIVNRVFDYPNQFSGPPVMLAVVLFAFQIYCDFSGYSDVAIGAARVMGFRLMGNFDRPYISKTVGEFWRRWHISLSTWFKDYVYIPLGGSRVNTWRVARNIFIVFLISGLWHGAAWTYLMWGAFLGLILIGSLVTKNYRAKANKLIGLDRYPKFLTVIQTGITFSLICVAWVFFRAKTISDAWTMIAASVTNWHQYWVSTGIYTSFEKISTTLGVSTFTLAHLLVAIFFMEWVEKKLKNPGLPIKFSGYAPWVQLSFCVTLILWIIFFGYFGERPFIYFQF